MITVRAAVRHRSPSSRPWVEANSYCQMVDDVFVPHRPAGASYACMLLPDNGDPNPLRPPNDSSASSAWLAWRFSWGIVNCRYGGIVELP
ncbi:MAG: hypothetical protein FJ387_21820 [Verrucomicrobia bacterium]|nr:hypothetical protein [Verrucomicrobiota bacterium]